MINLKSFYVTSAPSPSIDMLLILKHIEKRINLESIQEKQIEYKIQGNDSVSIINEYLHKTSP